MHLLRSLIFSDIRAHILERIFLDIKYLPHVIGGG